MACVNEYKEVYMLGSNLEGELGIGNKRCCKEICRVENVDGLETIECGVNFVVGFTYDYID